MTSITLFWGDLGEKKLLGLESRGHSGSGFKGEDVVCAAVSTLINALILGLKNVARVSVESEVDASVPLIRVEWPEDRAAELSLLTRTVALSLKEIAARYAGHVSISEVYRS